MRQRLLLLIYLLAASVTSIWADDVTYSLLQYESLPDMATPRLGHACFATANGDIIVVGGHTTSFYLTNTAERLHNGQWEPISISNAHDGAANIVLPDGRVLICGGMGSGRGIGQSRLCDIYDPETNSFSSTGSLHTARAFCTGVATGDGNKVLLSGNWYNSDTAFELWDGSSWTSFGNKDTQMNNPFVVNAGQGIVYVFGCKSNYGSDLPVTVYKVNTNEQTFETVTDTGLEEYVLIHGDYFTVHTDDGGYLCLGKKDDALYLLSFNAATAKVSTIATLPTAIPDVTTIIDYSSGILVNPSRKEAYIIGGFEGSEGKTLVLLTCNTETGKVNLQYGGPFNGNLNWGTWALQPTTGKIVVTGGAVSSNFNAVATSIIIEPFGDSDGIESVTNNPARDGNSWYTLEGRRLNAKPTPAGIYINNGQKVIVK